MLGKNSCVKRSVLMVSLTLSFLLCTSFLPLTTRGDFGSQPPIDLTTLNIGSVGQPRRVDPSRAYDSSSGELIQNVYQPLIWFSDKRILPDTNMKVTEEYLADLSQFEPILATSLPTISPDRLQWTFTINTSAVFHDWVMANGTVRTGVHLTPYDVVYSFQRMLVQDMRDAPSWMFCLPGTGYMFYDALDTNPDTSTIEPPEMEAWVAKLIQEFVYTGPGINDVTFNFTAAWPENALKQIFAQTWGGVGNKAFCIEHGCWDGLWTAGWSTNYRRKPSNSYSPLDRWHSKSKYTNDAAGNKNGWGDGDVPAMCGTGPYEFTSWNTASKTWRIDRFLPYWKGWAEAGDKAGNYVSTVIVTGIESWLTRQSLFLQGTLDLASVPSRSSWKNLFGRPLFIDPSDPEERRPIEGFRSYWNIPSLSNEVATLNLDVSDESPFDAEILGVRCSDFFGNVHVRRAFAHAVNYSEYIEDAWYGDALPVASWWIEGLAPDYENKSLAPHELDPSAIQSELQQAYFPTVSNSSVWETGFEVFLTYNIGNEWRRLFLETIASTFADIDARFRCDVRGIDPFGWLCYCYDDGRIWPIFMVGWLVDFADPDNFVRPYMHSNGDFAYFQSYNDPYVDALIDLGLTQPDGPERNATYQELQYIYWRDVPGLPIAQPTSQRFSRDWLKGFYVNQLVPGAYAYDLYKTAVPLEAVDVDITQSVSPSSPPYSTVYLWNGEMRIGSGDSSPARMGFTVHIVRKDNNTDIPSLPLVVALKRTQEGNPSNSEYVNLTSLSLAPDSEDAVQLSWWEDGVNQKISPQNATWIMTFEVLTVTSRAYDSDVMNNIVSIGNVQTMTGLTAEINGDGTVDILDAITLSNVFGLWVGETGFNALVDLNADDTIDILDAIILANNFGNHMP